MPSSKKPAPAGNKAYSLEFNLQAKKELDKLNSTVRLQLLKKLQQRLMSPRVEADKLRDMPDCYKIKLRSIGYRLVYEVVDDRLIVIVVAVGKREHSKVYVKASSRLQSAQK